MKPATEAIFPRLSDKLAVRDALQLVWIPADLVRAFVPDVEPGLFCRLLLPLRPARADFRQKLS